MDLKRNVTDRVRDYAARLEAIDRAIAEGMGQAANQRRINYLRFLYYERKVHSLALVELEALLDGSKERGAENEFGSSRQERTFNGAHTIENEDRGTQVARRTYRIITRGGIGDVLLMTPAIRALKQLYPDSKVCIYCIAKSHRD